MGMLGIDFQSNIMTKNCDAYEVLCVANRELMYGGECTARFTFCNDPADPTVET